MEQEPTGLSRGKVFGPALAVAVIVLLVWSAIPRGQVPVMGARATRGPLEVSILCDGEIDPPPGGVLRAPEAGTLVRTAVRDGEKVEAGQFLLRLHNPDLEARLLSAREGLSRLLAEDGEARATVENARVEWRVKQKIATQDEALLKSGAVTQAARDADQMAAEEARARWETAKSRLVALEGGQSSSLLALSRQQVRDDEQRVNSLTLRAPFAGVVYGLPRHAGINVTAGDALASLAQPQNPEVKILVDQPDVPRVTQGQKVVVTFDGLPGQSWDGTVTRADNALRPEAGRLVGTAQARLADPARRLPLNASVNVAIIVGQKPDVLLIPRAALLGDTGAGRYVFILRNGRAMRQDISIGLIGTRQVEVTSGLSGGEMVIEPGGVTISSGQRVSLASS